MPGGVSSPEFLDPSREWRRQGPGSRPPQRGGQSGEPPTRAHQGPLDGEELLGHVFVLGANRSVGVGGDPTGQILEGGGE